MKILSDMAGRALTLVTKLPISEGGTGASNAATALLNLGGVSVDGTQNISGAKTFTAATNFSADVTGNNGGLTKFATANLSELMQEEMFSGTKTWALATFPILRLSSLSGNITIALDTTGISVDSQASRVQSWLCTVEQSGTLRTISWPSGSSYNWLTDNGAAPTMATNTTYYVVLTKWNISSGTDRYTLQSVGSHATVT